MYNTEKIQEKFYEKLIMIPFHSCWEWIAGTAGGYGWYRDEYAHRFSYKMHKGIIPKGVFVLHTCDNPLCVNPDHLFLGSNADNQADKVNKGRQARGEGNGRAKLTQKKVDTIRIMYGTGHFSQEELAKLFSVTQTNVSRITRKTTWP